MLHTSPMMFTRPGLREMKSGSLPYSCLNLVIKLFHRFVCPSIASSGYTSFNEVAIGTSIFVGMLSSICVIVMCAGDCKSCKIREE